LPYKGLGGHPLGRSPGRPCKEDPLLATDPKRLLATLALAVAATLPVGAGPDAPPPAGPAFAAEPSADPQDAGVGAAQALDAGASPAVLALRRGIDDLLGAEGRGPARWSVLAVSLDRGDTLFARAAHAPLAPASNMKLFTAAAALEYLGPEHRFTTYLLTDGPVRDGVLEGNLYLYGTGDPTLGIRFSEVPALQLRQLADTLAALGVREVRGDVVGDGSYFSGPGTGEGWRPDYMNAWYATPAGGLSVHENLVRVIVRPGAPGGPPALSFVPGGSGVAVRNEAVTGGAGPIRVARADFEGPILVTGGKGAGASSHAVPVGDAAMYAAALLRDVLLERDFELRGGLRSTDWGALSPLTGRKVFAPALQPDQPRLRVLATVTSGPLLDMLHVINHQSHNFYSEQVFRAIGRAWGDEGSAHTGARAVTDLLALSGVDTSMVRIVDGCGLSPLNQVSAGAFVALLAHMAKSPHAEAFMETLPVAGEVRRFRRMGGTPAQGNLRAKTGTINNVSALSGYVTAANGERIAFSIIGNDLAAVSRGKYVENMIGARLAAFDRGPGAGGGLAGEADPSADPGAGAPAEDATPGGP